MQRLFAALLLGSTLVLPALTPALADTTITVAGSTALLPLAKDAAGAYQQAHPDVKISVSGGGSGTGMNQVAAKAVDIGNSDILPPANLKDSLHDNRVCVVGFSVILHPGLKVKNLTKAQIQEIFTGKVTNWNQVGGADQKIVIVNRPRSSGTRAVFVKALMGGKAVNESGITEDATGTVVSVVKQTPGAVSYASWSGTKNSGLTEVSIDGVEPDDANVINGKYAFWSYEHMYTNGPPTGEISRFIAFLQTRSDLIKKNAFIKMGDMKVKETDR